MKKDHIKKLSDIIKRADRKKLIVFLGFAGMFLILLSELIPESSDNRSVVENIPSADLNDSDMYKSQLENELKGILSNISGVGDTQIMLTLDGTTEYIYAEELETDKDTSDTSKKENSRSKIVITEKGGEKNALIKKIKKPQVMGVLIACSGGDDIHIKEQVIGAVSAVLGIPAGKVCVLKLK
ncbi:MAG: stage III sporulation protein AG [Ruminococcus sp.]|nr:stage III sporulation protein AG [Ruminococcus sp.]